MPLFTLSSLTCHRFVIASITVSSKGLCDAFCTNSLYAKVGGISVTELNVLEREFLAGIEWRLMVSIFAAWTTVVIIKIILFASAPGNSCKSTMSISFARIPPAGFLSLDQTLRACPMAIYQWYHVLHRPQMLCVIILADQLWKHQEIRKTLLDGRQWNKIWHLQLCRNLIQREEEGCNNIWDSI